MDCLMVAEPNPMRSEAEIRLGWERETARVYLHLDIFLDDTAAGT